MRKKKSVSLCEPAFYSCFCLHFDFEVNVFWVVGLILSFFKAKSIYGIFALLLDDYFYFNLPQTTRSIEIFSMSLLSYIMCALPVLWYDIINYSFCYINIISIEPCRKLILPIFLSFFFEIGYLYFLKHLFISGY